MPFTVAARTLLELGKELISSDEVAIYELIKNCVDAQSPTIRITAQIVLTRSSFQAALDMLNEKEPEKEQSLPSPKDVLVFVENAKLSNVAPEAWEVFLSDLTASTGDRQTFREALALAYSNHNWIEVRDAGVGMSFDDLLDVFLRIGTRSRRVDNVKGAQYLGDKGVGRLSAMRLGDQLQVTTTKSGEQTWHHLDIDWKLFSHDSEMDINQVEINPVEGEPKKDVSICGTTIRISDLNGNWDMDRFNEVLEGKIARMIDPFAPGSANKLLVVNHNTTRVLIPSIPQSLLAAAHASAHGRLFFDEERDYEPVLEGKVTYHRYDRERSINQRGVEIYSIAQNSVKRRGKRGHAAVRNTPINPKILRDLGEFKFDIYWYNRRIVEKVPGLTVNALETKNELAKWSGGPMLYRYGFRVLPYGAPEDDWLNLDVVAFGESGFKLNRQQVIGRIRVWSPHTVLSEQTNRQGLVDSDAATALRTIVMWVLHVELRDLINEVDEEEQLSKRQAEEKTLAFRNTQREVQEAVAELRINIDPATRPLVERVATGVDTLADQCANLVQRIDDAVKEVTDEREKFVYLAGIGLMTEFIFHELDRSVSHTLKLLANRQHSNNAAALLSLEAQLTTLQKRISAFDELTNERRQSKSTFDLVDVVRDVLVSHTNEFERHNITAEFEAHSFQLRAVRGMVIQILENLLSNSLYWLKQQAKYQTGFEPRILIRVDPIKKVLTVEDNGPGIAPERRELIFQPFVTSKPAAQGRGLGLFISRELAEYHNWQLYLDSEVGKYRADRLNIFVLDMRG